METKKAEHMLLNGVPIPGIAFGTWRIDGNVAEVVGQAIECGYRSIDCAYSYGNDFYVGRAIKKSSVPREELFVTNKLWNTFRGKEAAIEACKKSLRLMKMEYFDLYLIHWPVPNTQDGWKEINADTWAGLEELYREGIVRAIGVSNFKAHHMEALVECGATVLPMVNQVEYHPGFHLQETEAYCREHNILIEGWSPLGSGEVLRHPELLKMAEKYH